MGFQSHLNYHGMNPRDIPPPAPGEAYDLADFTLWSTSLIPTLAGWGVIILVLLVAVSVMFVIK